MVGIGVTTHNRPVELGATLRRIKGVMPKGAKLVVVDDASETPAKEATYRFERNVGIAKAKNKCLELLVDQGCDQLFLFDDDCWPEVKGWERPYIESPEPHMMYIFKDLVRLKLSDSEEIYRDSNLKAYTHPRGCMLYFDARVLDVVGGFDTRYKRWGYEHVDLSNRIFNAGLTSFRFADVVGSEALIHSCDEYMEVSSTVSREERRPYLVEMEPLFKASFNSSEYCEYREPTGTDIVLTSFLTRVADPQRGKNWQPDYAALDALRMSLEAHSVPLVVLNDCFDVPDTDLVTHVQVETVLNPYFQRWLSQYQYLRDHPEIGRVWLVDATDVEMLHNPFPEMGDRLYVGDEPTTVADPWMIQHHPTLHTFLMEYRPRTLLNCGVLGGSRAEVMSFCHEMVRMYFDNSGRVGDFEMGIFNYVAYKKFPHRIDHGRNVTTVFKAYDTANPAGSWWKHK